jgi:hypothetical protein
MSAYGQWAAIVGGGMIATGIAERLRPGCGEPVFAPPAPLQ